MSMLASSARPWPIRFRVGRGPINPLSSIARARAAHHEYNHFAMLSDAELSARGLNRDDVARHIGAKYFDI